VGEAAEAKKMSRDVTFVTKSQAQPPSFFFLSLLPPCHPDVYQSSTLSISGEFTGTGSL
jgi:hypothetical protein